MEEIRSTDVLDKEIRADSVKKAGKILAQAEETAKSYEAGVPERLEAARQEAEKKSREFLDSLEKNVNALIPLEKQRCLVSFINDSVVSAVNSYLQSLDLSKKNNIVEKMVERSKNVVSGKELSVSVSGGFDPKDADSIMKKIFGNGYGQIAESESSAGDILEFGIKIRSLDGKVKCRLTLGEKINEIMAEKREELALALFDGRLPE